MPCISLCDASLTSQTAVAQPLEWEPIGAKRDGALEGRLAAIMAADMVGYSCLVAADEAGTISRHKSHRRDLIESLVLIIITHGLQGENEETVRAAAELKEMFPQFRIADVAVR